MTSVRARGEAIRRFIVGHLESHPSDIAKVAAEKFDCTRQAVHKHLQRLAQEGLITVAGQTRGKTYALVQLASWEKHIQLAGNVAEGDVWLEHVKPALGKLPDNVLSIWQYGFTEMFNNAIDHSGGTVVTMQFTKTAAYSELVLIDDGVGIFRKIKDAMGLLDERHSVLELAKGKFTTDPRNHSGEGIFFTSRAFDEFDILSGGVFFSHEYDHKEDWIIERRQPNSGTLVHMRLNNHTARRLRKVFDQFSEPEEHGFTKTVVPVRLMQYGDDNLVSRSQARRLLVRIDRFKVVMLDFTGVASIGQAFADEVFRVFHNEHPEITLLPTHANADVKFMIGRALTLKEQSTG